VWEVADYKFLIGSQTPVFGMPEDNELEFNSCIRTTIGAMCVKNFSCIYI